MELRWFDGHLDLAYLVEQGRDMHAPLESCRGKLLPAAVTLPSLAAGGVRACLGTIFTEAVDADAAGDAGPSGYPAGDAEAAWRAGMRQLKLYHAWRDAGAISLLRKRSAGSGLRTQDSGLLLGILMECADPIRSPEELEDWVEAGVIAIGMAWWRGSRYAAGNGCDAGSAGDGLSGQGRELAARMDELGIVHDLTHLSQRATDELLELTDSAVIASHSNCRALLDGEDKPDWQRHLADETIREVGRRGGIVGVNLVRGFIRTGLDRADPKDRPSIHELIAHIEHVCEVMGHRRGVALGSDMDGGITAHDLPAGIDIEIKSVVASVFFGSDPANPEFLGRTDTRRNHARVRARHQSRRRHRQLWHIHLELPLGQMAVCISLITIAFAAWVPTELSLL